MQVMRCTVRVLGVAALSTTKRALWAGGGVGSCNRECLLSGDI